MGSNQQNHPIFFFLKNAYLAVINQRCYKRRPNARSPAPSACQPPRSRIPSAELHPTRRAGPAGPALQPSPQPQKPHHLSNLNFFLFFSPQNKPYMGAYSSPSCSCLIKTPATNPTQQKRHQRKPFPTALSAPASSLLHFSVPSPRWGHEKPSLARPTAEVCCCCFLPGASRRSGYFHSVFQELDSSNFL